MFIEYFRSNGCGWEWVMNPIPQYNMNTRKIPCFCLLYPERRHPTIARMAREFKRSICGEILKQLDMDSLVK